MSDSNSEVSEYRRERDIKCFAMDRKIDVLCHFTRLENLPGILQNGLLCRRDLGRRKLPFCAIDNYRQDGCLDAVCLSISFPNYLMFYKKRRYFQNSQQISDSNWVVLLLDVSILWDLECEFCQVNAADAFERAIPRPVRRTPEALKRMFCDLDGRKRVDLKLPRYYPTSPQAEVLVLGNIPATYIRQVHFFDYFTHSTWLNYVRSLATANAVHNSYYFSPREDYVFWQKDRSENP